MSVSIALVVKVYLKLKMLISEILVQEFNHSRNSQEFIKTTQEFNSGCGKPCTWT